MTRTLLFIGSILAVAILAPVITLTVINRGEDPATSSPTSASTAVDSPTPAASTPPPSVRATPTQTPKSARGQRDPLDEPSQTDAIAVATAVAETANNFDTRVDRARTDAHRRASYLYTPELADELSNDADASEDWEWLTWSGSDLFAIPTVTRLDDPELPAGNKVSQFFAFRIDLTLHGAKGDQPPEAAPYTQFITLTRDSEHDPWRASELTTTYDLEWGETNEP